MPKVLLQVRRDDPHAFRGGMYHMHIKSIWPFYQAGHPNCYIHRIRYARVQYRVKDNTFSHITVEHWCGGMGSVSDRGNRGRRIMEFADGPICATCEGRAIGAGQVDSHAINGRPVIFTPRKDRSPKAERPLPIMPIESHG